MAHRFGRGARGIAVSAGAPVLVLDTNVWLDLLVFDDRRCTALADALRDGSAVAVSDAGMADELARVLGYAALGLDEARRADAMAAFAALARRVEVPATPQAPRCRDPDDQMFVDLALAAGADALLSRDDAVLRLASRLRARGIQVATPADWCAARAAQISKR